MCETTVDVRRYPELRLLCWNRAGGTIPREEAFRLYEREWRLIDPGRLSREERELVRELTDEFGDGLLNA